MLGDFRHACVFCLLWYIYNLQQRHCQINLSQTIIWADSPLLRLCIWPLNPAARVGCLGAVVGSELGAAWKAGPGRASRPAACWPNRERPRQRLEPLWPSWLWKIPDPAKKGRNSEKRLARGRSTIQTTPAKLKTSPLLPLSAMVEKLTTDLYNTPKVIKKD